VRVPNLEIANSAVMISSSWLWRK